MNTKKHYPDTIFKCPHCGQNQAQGFDFEQRHCRQCETDFFSLGDVPCLFSSGIYKKHEWQHEFANAKYSGEQGLLTTDHQLSRYDLTQTTRQRLTDSLEASKHNLHTMLSLVQEYGIEPQVSEQFPEMSTGDIYQYADYLFRDWGWDTATNPNTENSVAFNRVKSLVDALPIKPKRILVLGAGAGRLSWDLHATIKPEFTIAADINPLLLCVSEHLISQQKPLTFYEFKPNPQVNRPLRQHTTLTPPADPENLRASWFALGADIWQLPLNLDCFDLIVTPWLIDVMGEDIRDLIGVIHQSLTVGGHWINTGPLLYPSHLPVRLKYNDVEIKEFIALAGLTFIDETIASSPYLHSPIEAKHRVEQVWSFSVRKNAATGSDAAHAWLFMHHLAIPQANYHSHEEHPLIDMILSLVDGKRSINEICAEIVFHIPAETDVKDLVVTLFGQMLDDLQLP